MLIQDFLCKIYIYKNISYGSMERTSLFALIKREDSGIVVSQTQTVCRSSDEAKWNIVGEWVINKNAFNKIYKNMSFNFVEY